MKIGSDGVASETRASQKNCGGLRSGNMSTTSQMYGCPRSLQLT